MRELLTAVSSQKRGTLISASAVLNYENRNNNNNNNNNDCSKRFNFISRLTVVFMLFIVIVVYLRPFCMLFLLVVNTFCPVFVLPNPTYFIYLCLFS